MPDGGYPLQLLLPFAGSDLLLNIRSTRVSLVRRIPVNNDTGRRSVGAGWEAVHVEVDDATRMAYVEVLADQTAPTAVGFLRRAIAWFAGQGITVREVMTDNGSAYVSFDWARACATKFHVTHIRTKPYRPGTNGNAERFIQTLLREWAYGRLWQSSTARRRGLASWLRYYNTKRPHGSLGHKPPYSALAA